MSSKKWIQTKFRGVRYYEHETRRHGIKKDRYYSIRIQKDGVRREEGLGWGSDGWTEEKAILVLANIRKAQTTGEGEQSLKEKREKAKSKRIAEEEDKKRLESENITFNHFYNNDYKPIAERSKKPQTMKAEDMHFNLWISPIIGDKPFKDIKSFDIERIKEKLHDAGRSPRTVQYVLATTRQVWNMARRDGLIVTDSPTRNVKVAKVDNKRLRFLTFDEEKQLLNALKNAQIKNYNETRENKRKSLQLYHITLLSLRTGMRASEIFNLKWNCIDTENGRIMIMDAKGNKNRTAFMTDDIKSMFEEIEKKSPSDYIFQSTKGGKHNEVSNVFALTVKKLKFNDDTTDRRHHVCFHTCRHTFASRLAESGVDLYTIKTLLGHSTIALTERYSHLSDGALQGAMRTLDDCNKKSVVK